MPRPPRRTDVSSSFDWRGFDLVDPPSGFLDDPYSFYRELREKSPRHPMAGGVLLTRYADVVAVYRFAHASSDKTLEFRTKLGSGPLYEHHTTSLVFNDPPLHGRVRPLITGALNQAAIRRMEGDVSALVSGLLDEIAEGRVVEFITAFAARIPVEVIGNLLAIPSTERGPLRGWSTAILSGLEPAPGPQTLQRGDRAVSEFLHFLKDLVDERRRWPGNRHTDVLTRFIQGEAGGERLTDKELYHQCIFLLNAGHETTTNLIGNGLWLLLEHPESLRRLREEPGLLERGIEEMLRFEGPIQLNNRRLLMTLRLGETQLSAGTPITLSIGAANRDPAQFPAPDRFDVSRSPNRHLAFGQGVHACAGMNVARMEARVAFTELLRRFSVWEPGGEPVRDPRVRFRGFLKLPVRFEY